MYLQVQHPMFDGRPLVAASSLLGYPKWQSSNASGQFVRKFGKIVPRHRRGVDGLNHEIFFCQLRNTVKADSNWRDPFPVTDKGMENSYLAGSKPYKGRAAFIARRLFFDGLYSGKIDFGLLLPSHLALHYEKISFRSFYEDGSDNIITASQDDSAESPYGNFYYEPVYNRDSLEGIYASVRHALQLAIRFSNEKLAVGKLGRPFAEHYACATSKDGTSSSLVNLSPPSAFLDILSRNDEVWGEIPGWSYTKFHFAEVYWRSVQLYGREIPLFVARINRRQRSNRGRQLRLSTQKYVSELANVNLFLETIASSWELDRSKMENAAIIHAHLKSTLKFFSAQSKYEHINWAKEIVSSSFARENIGTSIGRLAEIDSYWEASKQREIREIVMGDKVGGDKVSGDKFGGDKVGGDKVGGDKTTAETGGVALSGLASVEGGIKTSSQTKNQFFDLGLLAADLSRVASEMRGDSQDVMNNLDADLVEKAAGEAKAGNEHNVIAILKKAGSVVLKVAEKISADLAVAFLKEKLGF